MSCKPNPYLKPERKKPPEHHEKRITYSGKADAKRAAQRRGGNSRPYKVKGGWRITRR
jgi:hypothetical protein